MKMTAPLWEMLRNNIFSKDKVLEREKAGKQAGTAWKVPAFFERIRKTGPLELAYFL